MKKVKISLYVQNSVSFKKASFLLETLSKLRHKQIKRLQLCCIGCNGLYPADLSPSVIIGSLNYFFKRLSCPVTSCGLTHLNLNECELALDNETLKILARHQRNLKVLQLQSSHFKTITKEGLVPIIANCKMIERLEVLGFAIDSSTLKLICCNSKYFKYLSIQYLNFFKPACCISAEAWKQFADCYSLAVVEIKLVVAEDNFDTVFYSVLCSYIPVTFLNLSLLKAENVLHIKKYYSFFLKKLTVKKLLDEEDMEKSLFYLTKSCQKCFEINLLCPKGLKLLKKIKSILII